MKKWGIVFCFLLVLTACEKTIQINTSQNSAKLVVEAQIETGQAPVVVLSNSLNYFSEIDPATLSASFIHGAKVTIQNGSGSYTLQEFSQPINSNYTAYYYTTPQTNPSNTLFGEQGKKYDLIIETGGQIYTSSTTVPVLAKKIDSIWWKKAPDNPDTTKAVIMTRVTDPPGYGNYIRYFTSVNRQPYWPGMNSVFDDQIIDGKTYDIQVDQGVNKNDKLKYADYAFFKRGDTATIKFCNIDKASYDFWRTWEFTYQSVGNPFSSPGKVISNISNGGLGSFCGYAAQYKTLIIPK